jgi:hypothetical protein
MVKTRMSRGLGKMQHLILASLKPAKQAHVEGKFSYIGAASFANVISRYQAFGTTGQAQAAACFRRPSRRRQRLPYYVHLCCPQIGRARTVNPVR